jgi:CheY-specific phosphatase CheX
MSKNLIQQARTQWVLATLESIQRVFDGCFALETTMGLPTICEEEPQGAVIPIQVSMLGDFQAVVQLSFQQGLARHSAVKLMGLPESAVLRPEICLDAAIEMSNILLGNATAPLHDAGYKVLPQPPRPVFRGGKSLKNFGRCVMLPIHTEQGDLILYFSEIRPGGPLN